MSSTEERIASEKAKKLVANHEFVALRLDILGATELGDAERSVLEYFAELESLVDELRKDATRYAAIRAKWSTFVTTPFADLSYAEINSLADMFAPFANAEETASLSSPMTGNG